MDNSKIYNVLIVGAGWVGRQVAARFALRQRNVWLIDQSREKAEQAVVWMRQLDSAELHDDSKHEVSPDWVSRVQVGPTLVELQADPSLAAEMNVDLVLESVPEQLSLKRRVLHAIGEIFPPPVVVASNSSYFVPSLLAKYVAEPARYAHFHFHVPVLRDTVADIVGCDETDPAVLARLEQFSNEIGQSPLMLRREHPGYIFNWMLQSLLKSALELAVRDVADPQDIDRSWKAVTGMPQGPFAMMDQIGLDVIEQVLANARWSESPEVDSEQLLEFVRQQTRLGHLGVKNGQGFYDYPT